MITAIPTSGGVLPGQMVFTGGSCVWSSTPLPMWEYIPLVSLLIFVQVRGEEPLNSQWFVIECLLGEITPNNTEALVMTSYSSQLSNQLLEPISIK